MDIQVVLIFDDTGKAWSNIFLFPCFWIIWRQRLETEWSSQHKLYMQGHKAFLRDCTNLYWQQKHVHIAVSTYYCQHWTLHFKNHTYIHTCIHRKYTYVPNAYIIHIHAYTISTHMYMCLTCVLVYMPHLYTHTWKIHASYTGTSIIHTHMNDTCILHTQTRP